MSDFKYLFSPYRIGKVEIKNRMVRKSWFRSDRHMVET